MMIVQVFILLLPLISSAPMQLQHRPPLHSFTSPKQLGVNIDGNIPVFDPNYNTNIRVEDTIFTNDQTEISNEEKPLVSTENGDIKNDEASREITFNIPGEKVSEEIPTEYSGTRYEEVPLEMTHPETQLFNLQLMPFEKFERQLKQDQVQHQMFKPFHIFISSNVQKLKPVQPEMPTQMQQISMMNEEMMQHQILALHRLQALQNLNAINMPLYPPQPLLVLMPMKLKDTEEVMTTTNEHKSETNAEHKTDYPYENNDPESVIIDAANSKNGETEKDVPKRTILLFPDLRSRFSLGEIISAIPWLPFEVNVPDTIAWAYNGISNGISGIISIIGQWPFSRPSSKSGFQNMMVKDPMTPIMMVMPMNAQMIQLPIMV